MDSIIGEKRVCEITVFYMSKRDRDGNNYRFYTVGDLVSEIEYFCIEEAGNLTMQLERNFRVDIIPKIIKRVPVSSYRKLVGLRNEKTNKKDWYNLYNHMKYQPDICIIQKNGFDINGNRKFNLYLTKKGKNVTKFFKYWRLINGNHMSVTGDKKQIEKIIKERFSYIDIIEI